MEFKDLKLEEISFTTPPTKTQVVNKLRDMHQFLTKMAGALLLDGSYDASDEPVSHLLGSTLQLKMAAEKFDAGPNSSGLAVPRAVPMTTRH